MIEILRGFEQQYAALEARLANSRHYEGHTSFPPLKQERSHIEPID